MDKNSIKDAAAPVIVAVVGLVLRLFQLTRLSIWEDEGNTLYIARHYSLKSLALLQWYDPGNPPLQYVFYKLYTLAFGYSEFAVRGFSAVMGAATIFVIYLIGKRLFNRETGLIAAVLLAFSPMHIYFSQMARIYALFLFLVSVSIFFYVRFFEDSNPRYLALSSGLVILASYLHYIGLFLLLFESLYFGYSCLKKKHAGPWLRYNALCMLLIIPLLYMILLAQLKEDASRNFFNILEIPYLFVVFSIGETGFIFRLDSLRQSIIEGLPMLLFSGIVFAAAAFSAWSSYLKNRSRMNLLIAYLAIPVVAVILVSVVKPIFRPRYLIGVLPAYLLLLSYGISSQKRQAWKYLLVCLLLMTSVFSLSRYYFNYSREPWRDISLYVQENEKPGDIILSTAKFGLDYYYTGNLTQLSYWERYDNITGSNSGVWLIYASYHQGPSELKQQTKVFLDNNYRQVSQKVFRDDSNELSGDMYIYYYSKP